MARPWFRCNPADESFFGTAPFRLREEFEIPRPAAEVWADLTADGTLEWCKILDKVEWTSPRPFGVGTTRTVSALKGMNVLHERYFAWEEGRRKSFYVEEASAPLVRCLAEDYLVEPMSETSCRFIWVIAADPRANALTRPVNERLLRSLFRDTRRHYGLQP